MPFVDPFIGTGGHGHTFPGASCPGLVQLSPDSGKQGSDWSAGYHYSDTEIAGFSHTHLSGAGIGDLCDILVTPTLAGVDMPGRVTSPFSHDKEKASAGSYSVDPQVFDIRAELTATRRVGVHRSPSGPPPAANLPCRSIWLRHQLGPAGRDAAHARRADDDFGLPVSKGWAQGPARLLRRPAVDDVPDVAGGLAEGYSAERREVRPSAPAACSAWSCARASLCWSRWASHR